MRCYCGKNILIDHTTYLRDDKNTYKRKVIEATCPYCLKFNAQLEWIESGIEKFEKPKLKHLGIKYLLWLSEPHIKLTQINIKQGSKSNMSWVYYKRGNIYNFNETLIQKAL